MGRLDYIALVTQSMTLNDLYSVYLVNAIGTTGFTITLPPISSDGINYELIRDDTTAVPITIQASGTDTITHNLSGDAGSTGSINILPQTLFRVRSFEGSWYVMVNSALRRSASKVLFSTSLTSATGPYFQVLGDTTTTCCAFSYPGMDAEIISMVDCVVGAGTPNAVTGTFTLQDGSTGGGTGTIYGTGSFSLAAGAGQDPPKSIIPILPITGLPPTPTVLELILSVSGDNTVAVNLYSVVSR
jgi:hypothetical protein